MVRNYDLVMMLVYSTDKLAVVGVAIGDWNDCASTTGAEVPAWASNEPRATNMWLPGQDHQLAIERDLAQWRDHGTRIVFIAQGTMVAGFVSSKFRISYSQPILTRVYYRRWLDLGLTLFISSLLKSNDI